MHAGDVIDFNVLVAAILFLYICLHERCKERAQITGVKNEPTGHRRTPESQHRKGKTQCFRANYFYGKTKNVEKYFKNVLPKLTPSPFTQALIIAKSNIFMVKSIYRKTVNAGPFNAKWAKRTSFV